MSDQWLTYVDAANALGMSVEGLRQRARREQWRRQLGNDGKALVLVPGDTARRPSTEAPGNQEDDQAVTKRASAGRAPGEIEVLQERIRDLRADLERERQERQQERERADRLTNDLSESNRRLSAIVEDVRGLERAKVEAEARATIAETAHKAAQEAAEARIEAVRSELQAIVDRQSQAAYEAQKALTSWRALPWWKRLAG